MVKNDILKNQKRTALLSKVPEVTVLFWIIKIISTGMGEAASDYLNFQIFKGTNTAEIIVGCCLVVTLIIQIATPKYTTWIYWLNVIVISIFCAMFADNLPFNLIQSTIIFATAVFIILLVWYLSEKTLGFNSIYTRRREAFYWATVLATFALGTAVGDLTADVFKLGFLCSGILFAILFFIPFVGRKLFHWNEVFTFWFCYIMTRPFGASFADWMDGNPIRDGAGVLGIPIQPIILISLLIIIALVWYMKSKGMDIKKIDEQSETHIDKK